MQEIVITFIISLAGLLPTLLSGIVAFKDRRRSAMKEEKEEEKKHITRNARSNLYLLLGGLTITLVSTIYAFSLSISSEKDKKEAGQRAQSAQHKIDSLSQGISNRADTIQQLTYKLIGKGDTLASVQDSIKFYQNDQLSKAKGILLAQQHILTYQIKQFDTATQILGKQAEILKQITGDNSKPILKVNGFRDHDTANTISIVAYNQGQYPITGVKIKVFEFYAIDTSRLHSKSSDIAPFDIPPQDGYVFYTATLPLMTIDSLYHYGIIVYWSRGSYVSTATMHVSTRGQNGLLKVDMDFRTTSGALLPDRFFEDSTLSRFKRKIMTITHGVQ